MLRSDAYQVIQIVYEYVSPISHSIFLFHAAASLFNECAYHRIVYEVQKNEQTMQREKIAILYELIFDIEINSWCRDGLVWRENFSGGSVKDFLR